jgi:hypothetical protein
MGWDGETAEQLKLALAEACGLRAAWFFYHIAAVILQVTHECKLFFAFSIASAGGVKNFV